MLRLRLRLLVIAALALLTFVHLPYAHATVSYLGCYLDKVDARDRALPLVLKQLPDMTVATCLKICTELGFPYAGLEYAEECFCGLERPPYEQLEESRCGVQCAGGPSDVNGEPRKMCGGAAALSVYHSTVVSKPVEDTTRPLICLVMMVKDEAHTIAATLPTVIPHVDCWYFLDTGSTDRTVEIMESMVGNLPGKTFHEPFIDYGASRNRVLDIAAKEANPFFTLMLSADEKLVNGADMRRFLQSVVHASGPQHGAYPVIMTNGMDFDSLRIARTDAKWRYKARVHEYLAPPDGKYGGTYRPKPDVRVLFNATDGPRRHSQQYFIRRILEEDLAKNENDTRSIFYLARTNMGLGNWSGAMYYFNLLGQRAKWNEEAYHGMVMRAIMARDVPGVTWQQRQEWLLDAYNYKPNDMDALHALAQEHLNAGRAHLAFLFASRMVKIPPPSTLDIVQNVLLRSTHFLYEYEGNRLLGFAARDISEWQTCVDAFRAVLKAKPNDVIVADRIKLCEHHAPSPVVTAAAVAGPAIVTTTTTTTPAEPEVRREPVPAPTMPPLPGDLPRARLRDRRPTQKPQEEADDMLADDTLVDPRADDGKKAWPLMLYGGGLTIVGAIVMLLWRQRVKVKV